MNSQRQSPWNAMAIGLPTVISVAAALIGVGVVYGRIDATLQSSNEKIKNLEAGVASIGRRIEDLEMRVDDIEGPLELEDPPPPAAVPVGAVVAFDSEEGCPVGWDLYDDAEGRFIVGVGRHSTHNEYGNEVPPMRVGDIGGENQTRLVIPNIPSHDHQIPSRGSGSREEEWALQATDQGEISDRHRRMTSITGEGAPFDIMPPFIALLLCQKQ